jgi:hypothetical protein
VGTSKDRGKQWQTTPKNLPKMQRARAIPVAVVPDKPAQGLNTSNNNNTYFMGYRTIVEGRRPIVLPYAQGLVLRI